MDDYFGFDRRLEMEVPEIQVPWEQLEGSVQEEILSRWEQVRGQIPEKIKKLEQEIGSMLHDLYEEEDFEKTCRVNSEIAELAGKINDLQIWFRVHGEVSGKRSHG